MKRIHAFGLLLAAFATEASADAVYTYTGNYFNFIFDDGGALPGSYDTTMRLTGVVTLAAPFEASTNIPTTVTIAQPKDLRAAEASGWNPLGAEVMNSIPAHAVIALIRRFQLLVLASVPEFDAAP